MWEKLIETDDLVSFERKTKHMNVRIEARLYHNKEWKIFVTYYDGKDLSYTEQYKSKTKEESLLLIEQLKKMKLKSQREIERLKISEKISFS